MMWSKRNFHSLLVGMQNGTATLEGSLAVSYKSKYTLAYDSAVLILGIYLNELKMYVHAKTCTWMFIATLFIIAKTWKQPRCPSVDEQVNCGTVEYYSV